MDLSSKVSEFISSRLNSKLEKHDKACSSALKKAKQNGDDLVGIQQAQVEERHEIERSHVEAAWLDDASARAKQINLVTHAPKFSHSDNKASGMVSQIVQPSHNRVGTHSLHAPILDVIGNAAALDVASFLLISSEGEVLWQQLRSKSTKSLARFADDDDQLHRWLLGFSGAFEAASLKSHSLAKQVFFPTAEGEYHLISPTPASSLMQAMHERVQHVRFSESAKQARAMRRAEKGCADDDLRFPHLLSMHFGGSKPQNVSLLNSRRGGKTFLLNSAPPAWTNSLRLPNRGKRAFWRLYERQVNPDIRELRRFLGSVHLKSNNMRLKEERSRRTSGLAEKFIQLVANLRILGEPGWTRNCDLPLHEQCLLDPMRYDSVIDTFESEREVSREADLEIQFKNMIDGKSWLDYVTDEYSRWLNSRLRKIRTADGEILRSMGDTEAQVWQKELGNEIARLRNDLELIV